MNALAHCSCSHGTTASVRAARQPQGASLPRVARNIRQQRRLLRFKAQDDQAAQLAAAQAAYEQAMKDPEARARMEQMQQAMSDPAMQQQMAEMQAFMSNQAVMQRMAELREDPELAPIFEKVKQGGMGELMKLMNDERILAKIEERLADLPQQMAAQQQAPPPGVAAAAPQPEPEINDMLDAARYGDMEAMEDFIAIGKDVNQQDDEGRTPLHYAVAYNQNAAVALLLDQSAVAVDKTDSRGNTPLHYAAGYGRVAALRALLDAGADKSAANGEGQTALELVKMAAQNPINQDTELMAKLAQ